MHELVVRGPLAARCTVALFIDGFVLSVAISFALAISRHQDVSGAPAAIGMALFAGTLGYRLVGLSYRTRGPEIVIHNYFRTRHVLASQIEGLDIGRATAGNLMTVRILTRDRAIPIDVVGVTPGVFGRNATNVTQRLERRRQELADWLAATATGNGAAIP